MNFKVGDTVMNPIYGIGTVCAISPDSVNSYVSVEYNKKHIYTYTKDGKVGTSDHYPRIRKLTKLEKALK